MDLFRKSPFTYFAWLLSNCCLAVALWRTGDRSMQITLLTCGGYGAVIGWIEYCLHLWRSDQFLLALGSERRWMRRAGLLLAVLVGRLFIIGWSLVFAVLVLASMDSLLFEGGDYASAMGLLRGNVYNTIGGLLLANWIASLVLRLAIFLFARVEDGPGADLEILISALLPSRLRSDPIEPAQRLSLHEVRRERIESECSVEPDRA